MSKITLISGANQGIGLATAIALARDYGHHVIVGSRAIDAGRKAVSQIEAEGGKATAVQLDLDSQASIEAAVKSIDRDFGHLDVLINNAAVLLDMRPELSLRDLLTRTMNTNVVGTACVTEALLPLLRKSERPNLVFVSSVMGSLAQALVKDTAFYAIDYKCYDASKAAVNMLALNYSRNLSDVNARVNVVCPGLCKTNLTGYMEWADAPEQGAERIVQLATLEDDDGTVETFSDRKGPIAW